MEDNAVAGPSRKHEVPTDPTWLFILFQDSLREAEDALVLGVGMMGKVGRALVWTMSSKFGCDQLGVPGQTCRVFERYLASLTRRGIVGNDGASVINYMAPRLMITVACCFQIATKSTNTKVHVGPNEIRAYLESYDSKHSIEEIIDTEKEIFRGIGYHVPLYNSVEMAELLAKHFEVQHDALELVTVFVQLAEMRRHKIEDEMRWAASLKHLPYGYPRVRTLHLAAACVAAAVKKGRLSAKNHIAVRLAHMLRVSSTFIKILRNAIIIWISAPERSKPRHRPNILRRQRIAEDAGHREPQPGPSQSSNMPS